MEDDWTRNSELKESVIKKFNEEFGGDISKLDELIESKDKFEKEKSDIENAVGCVSPFTNSPTLKMMFRGTDFSQKIHAFFTFQLSVNGSDVPSKISTALKHVQEALQKVQELSLQHGNLNQSVADYQEKVSQVKLKAEDYINKINDLEKACEYLKIIQEIGEVSNLIESALNEKNEQRQVINYLMLRDIYRSLKETKCNHLLAFTNETLHYWFNILKEKFGNDYEEILKVIKWPFVGNQTILVPTFETLNRFQILTEHLLQIQLYPFV